MIPIELTDEDAILFRQFREHQSLFQSLLKAGVLETKNGMAILNFDSDGSLTEIRKDVLTYKRVVAIKGV